MFSLNYCATDSFVRKFGEVMAALLVLVLLCHAKRTHSVLLFLNPNVNDSHRYDHPPDILQYSSTVQYGVLEYRTVQARMSAW